jgi:hypothetical protein
LNSSWANKFLKLPAKTVQFPPNASPVKERASASKKTVRRRNLAAPNLVGKRLPDHNFFGIIPRQACHFLSWSAHGFNG